jgi:hypothetical protein
LIGVEVDHHEDNTPALTSPVVHTLDDIDRLRVPNPATGAHILELDHKVDPGEARQRLGPGICLMGNLDPVECLWRGSPSDVSTAARAGRSLTIPIISEDSPHVNRR